MKIEKAGVIGTGMMGAEIALCFARAGVETLLVSRKMESAQASVAKVAGILDKSIKKGRMDEAKKLEILNNLKPSDDYNDVADCDFVVEAIAEVFEVKAEAFQKLDKICKESTVLASNTSSISISKLASTVSRDRAKSFVGTHFNSPASIMKLVEIIPGLLTSQETVDYVQELLLFLEKEPVKVKDVVGFGLNRLFHAFTVEACRLVEEGVCTPEDVDKICVYGLGHPVGIFRLADSLGIDLCVTVEQIMFDAYGDRFRPNPTFQRLVDSGKTGRKAGSGFYEYGSK